MNWGNNPETFQVIGSIASLIATIVYTIITGYLLNESRNQRRAIENEMSLRLRPWIGLFDFEFHDNHYHYPDADSIVLLIKNFGFLPAQNANCTVLIAPDTWVDGAPQEAITFEENGVKTLLPSEEGYYIYNLSEEMNYKSWKDARKKILITGIYSYQLGNHQFQSNFICSLKFEHVTTSPKMSWRNLEVI